MNPYRHISVCVDSCSCDSCNGKRQVKKKYAELDEERKVLLDEPGKLLPLNTFKMPNASHNVTDLIAHKLCTKLLLVPSQWLKGIVVVYFFVFLGNTIYN